MSEKPRERLIGHPSDYGGRTLEEEERERGERTADGDPLTDLGTADSAISRDTTAQAEDQ